MKSLANHNISYIVETAKTRFFHITYLGDWKLTHLSCDMTNQYFDCLFKKYVSQSLQLFKSNIRTWQCHNTTKLLVYYLHYTISYCDSQTINYHFLMISTQLHHFDYRCSLFSLMIDMVRVNIQHRTNKSRSIPYRTIFFVNIIDK